MPSRPAAHTLPISEPTVGRRRGRPRRVDGPAVTAAAIVESGLEAIQSDGWSGMALRDLARRLGVSLPAVQRHFPTKDDLWRACVDRLVAERLERRAEEVTDAAPADQLIAALRAQIERPSLEPGLTAAMLSDRSEGADERLAYLYRAVRPALDDARSRFNRAIEAGVMRPVDTDVVVALLGIGVSSLANAGPALRHLFGIDLDQDGQRDRFARTVADLLMFGLRGPAAPGRAPAAPSDE